MSKRRMLVAVAVAVAFALGMMVGCGGSKSSGGSPEATIKAFFAAAAKGDVDAMKKMVTGDNAAKLVGKTDAKSIAMMKAFGAAFKDASDVKIDKDTATATVNLDKDKLVALFLDAQKAKIAEMKDPKQKAQAEKMMALFKAMAPKLAEKMSKFPVKLAKKDGKWLITDLKGK